MKAPTIYIRFTHRTPATASAVANAAAEILKESLENLCSISSLRNPRTTYLNRNRYPTPRTVSISGLSGSVSIRLRNLAMC